MIVYKSDKPGFINDVNLNIIDKKVLAQMKKTRQRGGSPSEIRAWRNSLHVMSGVLADREIPNNVGIAIEYEIPLTNNRIDFLLTGYNNEHNNSVVIIELKQWESASIVDGKSDVVEAYIKGSNAHETPHPSYQAWSYASLIYSFNQDIADRNIKLHPCAFLHNYNLTQNNPINNKQYQLYIQKAPLFGSDDVIKLRDFIKRFITTGDNNEGLYIIENGTIKPTKMLQDAFTSILKGNKEFVLIDDQKLVFEDAKLLGKTSYVNKEKNVLIVEGGPGTGKSVVAINLLQEFLKKSYNCFYVTKNRAPRKVYAKKLKINRESGLSNLFKSSESFYNCKPNTFDVLIVDEAHRLNNENRYYPNAGTQVNEIIKSSMFSIFFIDENQRVTLQDKGSISEIKKYAEYYNAHITTAKLDSQFRCSGSDGYLAWLYDVLEIKETANYDLDNSYDFKVFDSPTELKDSIVKLNKRNNKSRLVAGYCWNWNKKDRSDTNVYDITIPEFNFGMSWNLGNTDTWAIDEESVNQVGCVHTCQGLEFDYVGVIIGLDLRYENGKLITDYTKRAKTDHSLNGIKKIAKEKGEDDAYKLADEIIKNTYYTLMTRGMKGCYVYCVDKELSKYLKERIEQ